VGGVLTKMEKNSRRDKKKKTKIMNIVNEYKRELKTSTVKILIFTSKLAFGQESAG
jgi:hypothetical protein